VALIRRFEVPLAIESVIQPWSVVGQNLRELYKPPLGLPAVHPREVIVTMLCSSLIWVEDDDLLIDGHKELGKAYELTNEAVHSSWEPAPYGRPAHEKTALRARIDKAKFYAQAYYLRDAIIATVSDIWSRDASLILVHLACARDEPFPRNCNNWVLVLSSKVQAPYHLSAEFSTLVRSVSPQELYIQLI
jgi:hypothetical protein